MRIITLITLIVSCFAVESQVTFLRIGKIESDLTGLVEISDTSTSRELKSSRSLKGKGKCDTSKKSSKSPKRSKKPKGKGKNKSSKSPKGKGKNKSSKYPKGKGKSKSSKTPKTRKGGKGKKSKSSKAPSSCTDPTPNPPSPSNSCEEKIRDIVDSVSGSISPSSAQESALNWVLNENSQSNTCELDDDVVAQRYILAVFYFSTNGDDWNVNSNWLSSEGECSWYGILCSFSPIIENNDSRILESIPPTMVGSVTLENNNLSGTIPKEIASLWNLGVLKLFDNNLRGELPGEFSDLALTKLDVENNNLEGPLFDSLSITLESLLASNNTFSGEIPDLSAFTSLRKLWISKNTFSGSIHNSLTSLSGLVSFKAYQNNLDGMIPNDLGDMISLKEFDISGNPLITGNIPDSIISLVDLETFDVGECGLSGNIPPGISQLVKLKFFVARHNNLEGEVPPLEGLTALQLIMLEHNELTGVLPDVSGAADLYRFDCSNNKFGGGIPATLMSLPKLELLYLDHNNLSGAIPENFGDSTTLIDIYLNNNMLDGEIPNGDSLESISELLLNDNNLNGSMPDSICQWFRPLRVETDNLWADCNSDGINNAKVQCDLDCCTTCFPILVL
mmetsp:Transcript_6254/g.7930  ORF Transcript_6254/g.7930 Transcript_6254/m.7930 type:complete len:619 (+) Transcript_6254:165-2021(+)